MRVKRWQIYMTEASKMVVIAVLAAPCALAVVERMIASPTRRLRLIFLLCLPTVTPAAVAEEVTA